MALKPWIIIAGVGCLGVVICTVGGVIWGVGKFMGYVQEQIGVETFDLPGNAEKYAPFSHMAEVRKFAGPGARLVSIDVSQVKRDGTVDLTATYTPAPYVEYAFIVPTAPPQSAPPVGAGGRSPGDGFYRAITIRCSRPGQRRTITKTTGSGKFTTNYVNRGLEKRVGDPESGKIVEGLPDPKCDIVKLWEIALARGADPQAVATISYSEKGYAFSIVGTKVSFDCDLQCRPTDDD